MQPGDFTCFSVTVNDRVGTTELPPSVGVLLSSAAACATSTLRHPSSSFRKKSSSNVIVACARSSGFDSDPVLELEAYPPGHWRGYPAIHSLADDVNLRRKAICGYRVGWMGGIARIRLSRLVNRSESSISTVGIGESGSVLCRRRYVLFSVRNCGWHSPLVVISVQTAEHVL